MCFSSIFSLASRKRKLFWDGIIRFCRYTFKIHKNPCDFGMYNDFTIPPFIGQKYVFLAKNKLSKVFF